MMVLELSKNNISVLSDEVAERLKTMRKVSLGGNPWICDCPIYILFNFLRDKEFLRYFNEIYCENLDKSLVDIDIYDVCFDWTFVAIIFAVVFGVLSLGVALFYKFNKDIKIFLYHHDTCLWFASEEELDKDKIYDAFFCFAAVDQHLVEDTIDKLEADPVGFELLVGARNWMAGQMIPELVSIAFLPETNFKFIEFFRSGTQSNNLVGRFFSSRKAF